MYLLKQKYQAFDVFKIFKAMAEKESDRFIKVRDQIEEVSICQMSLWNFVNIMELKDSLLYATLHSKTK